MRRIEKTACPDVLEQHGGQWLQEFLAKPSNETRRSRYRHPEIKEHLKKETFGKCVYCESKIGHNTPGDTEHIRPVKKFVREIFVWENLTISCAECNRRKGDYYDGNCMFLNPYTDNVEDMIVHFGPLVSWEIGNERAETTIRKLELDKCTRMELISRKIEKIEVVKNLLERIEGKVGGTLRELWELNLNEMISVSSEFSGMAMVVVNALRNR